MCGLHPSSPLKMENVTNTTTLVGTTCITVKWFTVCPGCTLQCSKKGKQVLQ